MIQKSWILDVKFIKYLNQFSFIYSFIGMIRAVYGTIKCFKMLKESFNEYTIKIRHEN